MQSREGYPFNLVSLQSPRPADRLSLARARLGQYGVRNIELEGIRHASCTSCSSFSWLQLELVNRLLPALQRLQKGAEELL